MDNFLLLSMLMATVIVPAYTSRIPDGRRALAWTLLVLVAFTLSYLVLVAGHYARNYVPEQLQP